jgi:hypothetical protein
MHTIQPCWIDFDTLIITRQVSDERHQPSFTPGEIII